MAMPEATWSPCAALSAAECGTGTTAHTRSMGIDPHGGPHGSSIFLVWVSRFRNLGFSLDDGVKAVSNPTHEPQRVGIEHIQVSFRYLGSDTEISKDRNESYLKGAAEPNGTFSRK